MNATERYAGNFAVKTKNPILVVSNSLDPVTPLVSAQNMTETFEGARLLVSDGYGHVSFGNPNVCMARHAQAYFANGTLPEVGARCVIEAVPFTNYTLVNFLDALKHPDGSYF